MPKLSVKNPKRKETCPYVFNFKYLDRTHELFNLGTNETKPTPPAPEWFIQLLDILKDGNTISIPDFNQKYRCHPTDWKNTNLRREPFVKLFGEDCEVYQFRVTHCSRVIGAKIENIFYIVYLDIMHNHCDSTGYQHATPYAPVLSIVERLEQENESLKKQLEDLITQ